MSNDEVPNPENEIIFIIDDVLKDGIIYYDSFVKRSKTKQQLESYMGIKRALEQANKQIVNLGIRNGLKSLKLYQKSVLDKLKLKKSTNQSFDAGLYRGYKEAIKKIEELAWPLFEGRGFTKDFQKEFESDTITFDLEECRNCGRKWSNWTKDTLEYCKRCDEIICNHCKKEEDCEWCFTSGAVERKRAEANDKILVRHEVMTTMEYNAQVEIVKMQIKNYVENTLGLDCKIEAEETPFGVEGISSVTLVNYKIMTTANDNTQANMDGNNIRHFVEFTLGHDCDIEIYNRTTEEVIEEDMKAESFAAEESQLKKAYDEGLKQLRDIGWEVNERQFTMDAVYAGQEESHTWEISASEEMLERYGDGQNLNQKAVRERVYEFLEQAGWDIYFDESMASFGFTEFHMGSNTPSGIVRGYEDNFENMGIINEAETFDDEDEGVCKLCGVRRAALNGACNPCRIKKGLRPYVFEKGYDDNMYCGSCKTKMKGYGEGHYCEKCDNPKITKMDSESFAAEGNKMKAAILRGIQAAIREEYVYFDGKADIAATVNMILRELGQLEGDTPVEMLDVGSAPAMRIDPYDVVAAMARAANQMAKINEESMVCWDMEDMFLDGDTKRLGWGLQSIFGIHALKAKVDGEDAWRVAGYPQAIETWFMLYNPLRINLQKEIKRVKKAEKEAFYQAFARHIRDNPNVKRMIKKNSKNREKAREISKNCFPAPESKKWVPVEEGVASKAKKLSDSLNPFASETFNNTNDSTNSMNGLRTRKSARFNSGDVKVLTIGVLIGAFGSLFGNFLTKKYLGPSVIVTTDDDDDDSQSDKSSTVKESDLISLSQNNRFIQTN